jgi:hypothetical protein
MQRRSFLKSIASVAGVKALAPLAPLMLIPNWRTDSRIVNSKPSPEQVAMMDGKTYSYFYVYRNTMTSCCSNASPTTPPPHTFAMPEHDVIDYYRLQDDGEFYWVETV